NLPLVKNCLVVGVYFGAYAIHQPEILIDSLRTLMTWYIEDQIKVPVTQTFPLAQASQAINALHNRQATGKVVIEI
ncbi:MAG: zinc-binding dehydrogenase, partial [Chloroflexota bacterium]